MFINAVEYTPQEQSEEKDPPETGGVPDIFRKSMEEGLGMPNWFEYWGGQPPHTILDLGTILRVGKRFFGAFGGNQTFRRLSPIMSKP